MGERHDEKTIKVPQARRTWTVEEHDDGSITITSAWRARPGEAAATSAPVSDPQSPVNYIARALRELFA